MICGLEKKGKKKGIIGMRLVVLISLIHDGSQLTFWITSGLSLDGGVVNLR